MSVAPTIEMRDNFWRTAVRWGLSIALVVGAHAGLAAGIFALEIQADVGAPPSVPILIDMEPPAAPQATTEDVSKILPEPEEPPPPEIVVRNPLLDMAPTPEPPPDVKIEVAIEIPPPEPPPPVDIKPPPPKPLPQVKPPERPVQRRVEPARAPPSTAPVETRAAGAPTSAPPAPAPNPSGVSSWRGSLMAHLARHKRYPRSAQMNNEQGVVSLRFTMTRSGAVIAQRVERSSGNSALDQEAVDLVRRAQPLPTPPADMPGDSFEFVVPIQFQLR